MVTHVDYLSTAVMELLKLIKQLQSNSINLKMKATVKINNQFVVLYMDHGEYVSKKKDTDVHHFGVIQKQAVQSLLEGGDHPELDIFKFLGEAR